MSISDLPLAYCTNVHPGRSVAEVEAGLDRYTVGVRQEFGHRLAAGLWLAKPVIDELLASPDRLARFAAGLRDRDLTCHTLNAFPFGDFHAHRVKENVYLPDWSSAERLNYTLHCARVLCELLPPDREGSISTLPIGFKRFASPEIIDAATGRLIECARGLDRLREETGKTIRLAIEPEPLCILETTPEAIDFFQTLYSRGERDGAEDIVRAHLGVCFDVCHQAVEFEDVVSSIRRLHAAGIRINKVHMSCALQLDHPGRNHEARSTLARYIEPRYLHQTIARRADGRLVSAIDLTEQLVSNPPADFLSAQTWRVHFHVPVDAERLGPLTTTRPALREALMAVAALDYSPHLEVETYTWEVLPGTGAMDLVGGLTRELVATTELLSEIQDRQA